MQSNVHCLHMETEMKAHTRIYEVFLNVMNRKEPSLDARFQISVKSCIGGVCIWQYWPLKIISDIFHMEFFSKQTTLVIYLIHKLLSGYNNTIMQAKASSSYQSLCYYCYSAICLQLSLPQMKHLPRGAWPV